MAWVMFNGDRAVQILLFFDDDPTSLLQSKYGPGMPVAKGTPGLEGASRVWTLSGGRVRVGKLAKGFGAMYEATALNRQIELDSY